MQLPSVDDLPILVEIASESDRGAAVIAAGFLDAKLSEAIKACLRDDKDTSNKLLKATGPLGPFGSRIELAYLLRLFRKETRDDLLLISKIRNEFAHKHKPMNFGSREILKMCEDLGIIKRVWGFISPEPPVNERPLTRETARSEYLESVSIALNFLHHQARHPKYREHAEELLPY